MWVTTAQRVGPVAGRELVEPRAHAGEDPCRRLAPGRRRRPIRHRPRHRTRAARARPVHSPQSCSASRGSTTGATAPRIRAVSTARPSGLTAQPSRPPAASAAEIRGEPPPRRLLGALGRQRRVGLAEHAPLGVPRRRRVTDQRDVDRAHGRPSIASPAARRCSNVSRVRSVATKRRAAVPIVRRRAGSSSSRATPAAKASGVGRGEERAVRRDHRIGPGPRARDDRQRRRRRPGGRRRGSGRGRRRGRRRDRRPAGSRARVIRGTPRGPGAGRRAPPRPPAAPARPRRRPGATAGSGAAAWRRRERLGQHPIRRRASSPRAWRRRRGSRARRRRRSARARATRQAARRSAVASKRARSTAGGRSRIRSAAKRGPRCAAMRGRSRGLIRKMRSARPDREPRGADPRPERRPAALRREVGVDEDVRDVERRRDGRADEVRGAVVALVGDPRPRPPRGLPPAIPGDQPRGGERGDALDARGVRRVERAPVGEEPARQVRREAEAPERGHQETPELAVAGGLRLVRVLDGRVEGERRHDGTPGATAAAAGASAARGRVARRSRWIRSAPASRSQPSATRAMPAAPIRCRASGSRARRSIAAANAPASPGGTSRPWTPVAHQLGDRRGARGDDRQSLGERLDDDVRQAVAVAVGRDLGREEEEIARPVLRPDRGLIECARPDDPVRQAERLDTGAEGGLEGPVADHGEPDLGPHPRHGLEEGRVPLLGLEAADGQEPHRVARVGAVASRPERRRGAKSWRSSPW